MALVRSSDTLLRMFADFGGYSNHQLKERLNGPVFHLEKLTQPNASYSKLEINGELSDSATSELSTSVDNFKAVRPWELAFFAGAGGAVLLGGVLTSLVYLYTLIIKSKGKYPIPHNYITAIIV